MQVLNQNEFENNCTYNKLLFVVMRNNLNNTASKLIKNINFISY